LFNGGPGIVASTIDALTLGSGARVLHVGCGLGYYTAILAHLVGASGRVDALEVDGGLADEARVRLESMSWVRVAHGDGSAGLPRDLDAILVSAGLTHVPDAWFDALAPDGRIVLPLTATLPQMGSLGKGPMLLLTRTSDGWFAVRRIAPVIAAYSAAGLRDEGIGSLLGQSMARAPYAVPRRLRRDPHEPTADCWLHAPTFCFSLT
jgi:protein-L-isoaspartate(D-aspartate) O-methyltransferase